MRDQTERVLADPLFGNSKRYSHLLKFIVDRTLEGNHDDLKERIIGIEVFGRSPDYDTSIDPTVRVVANEVRKRLAVYYAEPHRNDELRIEIPVRSYVAKFTVPKLSQNPVGAPTVPDLAPIQVQALRRVHGWYVWGPAAVVILALAVWGIQRLLSPASTIDKLWGPIIQSGSGQVSICLGTAPNANPVAPPKAVSTGSEDAGMRLYEFSARRVSVTMSDVYAANTMASFLKQKGKDSFERPTTITSLEDLRSSPAVFLGSFHNDWMMRLGADLHFRFRSESPLGLRWIEDASNPTSKSWSVDLSAPYDQVKDDYALVSRVLDPTTGQWWIGIGGLTGMSTLAASQAITDPKAMAALGSHLPKDWERKNLQIVLDIKMVQGSPGAFQVVSAYSW